MAAVVGNASRRCASCLQAIIGSSRPMGQPATRRARSVLSSRTLHSSSIACERKERQTRYQYNADIFGNSSSEDHLTHKIVDAAELSNRRTPPRRVRMLARDFIDDSLYNPHYGYFSTQATIFSDELPFDFRSMRSETDFLRKVAERYESHERAVEGQDGAARQVWHTPTELFKPYYGQAIARFLVAEYKLSLYPYDDLIIYEMGAGNGTLALDILDYIKDYEPDVYERTRYRIIEISPRLAEIQRRLHGLSGNETEHREESMGGSDNSLSYGRTRDLGRHRCIELVNRSIFEWTEMVPEPCFFLAMEVADNFAHDVVRYSTSTLQPYQEVVSIDASGDFVPLYEPASDPLISRYLYLRSLVRPSAKLRPPPAHYFLSRLPPSIRHFMTAQVPLWPNFTLPEFLPTKLLLFLDVLRDKFPGHRLLLSDFSELPEAVEGVNGPVVQTRYEKNMVACSTYMVQQGWFDIFFPTDFELLRDMYPLVMAGVEPLGSTSQSNPATALSSSYFSPSMRSRLFSPRMRGGHGGWSTLQAPRLPKVLGHRQFLERYGEIELTSTRNGENPMLGWYKNAKFMF